MIKKAAELGMEKVFMIDFLSNLSKKTIKIGLSLYEPENYIEGFDENDIKIDYCVTPNKIFSFLFKESFIKNNHHKNSNRNC